MKTREKETDSAKTIAAKWLDFGEWRPFNMDAFHLSVHRINADGASWSIFMCITQFHSIRYCYWTIFYLHLWPKLVFSFHFILHFAHITPPLFIFTTSMHTLARSNNIYTYKLLNCMDCIFYLYIFKIIKNCVIEFFQHFSIHLQEFWFVFLSYIGNGWWSMCVFCILLFFALQSISLYTNALCFQSNWNDAVTGVCIFGCSFRCKVLREYWTFGKLLRKPPQKRISVQNKCWDDRSAEQ